MACAADREASVREVAQVYELIKLQQPLLLLQSPPSTTQLAQSLLGKALRALNVALSVMKQQQPAAGPPVTPVSVVKAEPHHQLSPTSPASADSDAIAPSTAARGAKRRRSSVPMEGKKKTSSSWATVTAVPYDDGYEWRKYGEKKINGTLFTRSYFRCRYKDDACCLATKHVEQMEMNNNSDPPLFRVTYKIDHTCSAEAAAKTNTGSSSSNLAALLAGCCNGSGSGNGLTTTTTNALTGHAAVAAMNMKQEEPPLLQPSACFPYEQIPQCQQEPLFPTSMEQQFVCGALRDHVHDSPVDGDIPSVTGSCISRETTWWDGYSGDMAALMTAEDDPLRDLDRFLRCDSFK